MHVDILCPENRVDVVHALSLVEQVVDENHRTVEGFQHPCLVFQGRVILRCAHGEAGQVVSEIFLRIQRFRYRVRNGHIGQCFSERYRQIRSAFSGRIRNGGHSVIQCHQIHDFAVYRAGVKRNHQFPREHLGKGVQQPVVGIVDGLLHLWNLVQRRLDNRFHIPENDNRVGEVYRIHRMSGGIRNIYETLSAQRLDGGTAVAAWVNRMVDGIRVVFGQQTGEQFRQKNLVQIADGTIGIGVECTDNRNALVGLISNGGGNLRILKLRQQIVSFKSSCRRKSGNLPVLVPALHVEGLSILVGEVVPQGVESVAPAAQLLPHIGDGRVVVVLVVADFQILGLQYVFVRRLPGIEAAVVDVVLHDWVQQVGNIPPHIDVVPDLCGADILVVLFQLQVDDLSRNRVGLTGFFIQILGISREDDVVKRMDGVFARLQPIAGSVLHHVGSHCNVDFLFREQAAQFRQILRIGNVDGNIVRENIKVLFIGDGHGKNFLPQHVRQGLLGPGEFIDGQIYLVAHIPNGGGNGLVPQAERVEGSREERHLLHFREAEIAHLRLIFRYEAIDIQQPRRVIVELQILTLLRGKRDDGYQPLEAANGDIVLLFR